MKKSHLKKSFFATAIILCAILIFCINGCKVVYQPPERFFDTAEQISEEVRLAILYPSMGTIRALIELREQGLITIENLTVIGVYHENERTDYQRSIEYVGENDLRWFKFHKISGELSKDTLFQKNTCSGEFETIFNKSDGVIFFGGADIPPYIYGEKTNLLSGISTTYRHFLELSFIFHLLGGFQDEDFAPLLESEPEFPVLAICLGAQSLNVGTGGTLTQDIWSEIYGKNYAEDVFTLGKENWHNNPFARVYPEERLIRYNLHRIKLIGKGKLVSALGFEEEDTPFIISSHHQMVEKPGKGMAIIASSLDGKVPEAIEHKKYPHVLGTQFHPEFPILWDTIQKFRIIPQDEEGINLNSFLKDNPPSWNFHQKIWAWLEERLVESHARK
ncbi:MAG: gamma-glutamyl-gamma-aminobutyrate hydrolase family protein [Candidatus Aminicenantes bacterium]|nr:MAG: gamma-glutamyl-gamma-aminobutyrate hydrolase family protein [Candidatus Aminicenantes bacterium]